MKKLADIVETTELPLLDEVVVMDEAPESVVVEEPAEVNGDYEKTQDLVDFLPWLQGKLTKLPQHSGATTSGCERIIAHLKMLDKEISKAITRDFDCLLDDTVVEKFRKDIRKMVKKLEKRHKEINDAYDADDAKFASSGINVKTAESDMLDKQAVKQIVKDVLSDFLGRDKVSVNLYHELLGAMETTIDQGGMKFIGDDELPEDEANDRILPGELSKVDIGEGKAKPVEHKADDEELAKYKQEVQKRLRSDDEEEARPILSVREMNRRRDRIGTDDDLLPWEKKELEMAEKQLARLIAKQEANRDSEKAKRDLKDKLLDDALNGMKDSATTLSDMEKEMNKADDKVKDHKKCSMCQTNKAGRQGLCADCQKEVDEYGGGLKEKDASACACHIEKTIEANVDTCPTCNIRLWAASDSLMECIACDEVYTRKIVKEATTAKIQMVVSTFERAIAGIIVNSVVSQGRNAEQTYAALKDQYKFSSRDELGIQQLLQDMGYPVARNFMGAVDNVDGKSVEFATNYSA